MKINNTLFFLFFFDELKDYIITYKIYIIKKERIHMVDYNIIL